MLSNQTKEKPRRDILNKNSAERSVQMEMRFKLGSGNTDWQPVEEKSHAMMMTIVLAANSLSNFVHFIFPLLGLTCLTCNCYI